MSAFLARQPIFDVKLNVIGYELLYRSSEKSAAYDGSDPDMASMETIMHGLDDGIKTLTDNRLAFINFTETLLLNEAAIILPRSHLVVEILEGILPVKDVVKACRKLKKQGYMLSLDDFVFSEEYRPFLELVDIVKIDFLNRKEEEIKKDVKLLSEYGNIRLLAEKVETQEIFSVSKEMGFTLFQGYFFSKPVIMERKSIQPVQINQLQMMRCAMDPLVDYKKLAAIIKNDTVLSYRILRLVNSAYYGMKYNIKSIHHALAILGLNSIKKYVTLFAVNTMKEEKPEELMRISLIRGHFLESLAPIIRNKKAKEDLFLLGLFSLIDVMSDTPMEEIVEKTKMPEKVAQALTTGSGKYAELLSIIKNYEKGNWADAIDTASENNISPKELYKLYMEAVLWAADILRY
ncbi:EAL and HDOD domain-containing protein [Papillibacter cinnamivorans]|uniref:EAL and modified HD-GYP domain-containing signal transduction protein n=1 Tax=Papillibacter cinnamivorans DSM 12816 TaxID=1122930 RepID=A0A1W1YJC7_9FIRM|nr:HDOD domain-containing protein [Papillibacter cinnamivorans]SMC35848.1 EAL and modified HD-GYP domain-containing signal transduction protein [Papillibacter cinnamivorans DSM 12816]